MKNIISQFSLKELEKITFRALQESFSKVMAELLAELDQLIADNRDKQRFKLKDKRKLSFDSMFGHVELRRNYYLDRESGKYVNLLGGEGTMSVFAKRLKNGRSWCEEGITKFSDIMVALRDGQDLITQRGKFKRLIESDQSTQDDKPPKHFVERLTNHVQDTTRNNIAYLQQSIHKPVVAALRGLKGY